MTIKSLSEFDTLDFARSFTITLLIPYGLHISEFFDLIR